MADNLYAANSPKPYSDITLPIEEKEKKQTLGSFISYEIAPLIGEVVRKSKDGEKYWPNDMARLLSREYVAKRLGIKEDMLQKKLYHRDTSRDWIIAICAAYGLDAAVTDDALILYDWPGLDKYADRDSRIRTFLDAHRGSPTSLEMLNDCLESKSFRPLQIQKRSVSATGKKRNKRHSRFTQKSGMRIRTFGFEGDQYDSLETEFMPTHRVIAEMLVEGPAGELFELSAAYDGDLKYHALEESEDGKLHYKDADDFIGTSATTDHPDFGGFLLDLLTKVKSEMQKYDDRLNDSRNYKGRFSANLKENSLHVFYEEYNYGCPERNEYYLMEYWKGQFTLSISHESMFMQEYMSEDDFFEHYHSREKAKRKTYSSVQEIEALMTSGIDWETEIVVRNRKNTFQRLQAVVAAKVTDIQQRKIFIRNFDAVYDNPADVLRYYKIEDIFNCEYDPEYDEICNCLDVVTVAAGTEKEVVVTFDDVRAGFEYGFKSFEEICEFKRAHETLEDALK